MLNKILSLNPCKYKVLNTFSTDLWESHQKKIDEAIFLKTRSGLPLFRDLPKKSLELASNLFEIMNLETIIECGTGLQGKKSGNSSIFWVNKTNAKKIFCIDLDQKWIDTVFNKFGDEKRIIYKNADIFDIVPNIQDIDLIYMDFWSKTDVDREKDYLRLFKICNDLPKMILIDDTDHKTPWKHTLLIPEVLGNYGYKLLYIGRQSLLIRGDKAKEYHREIKELLNSF